MHRSFRFCAATAIAWSAIALNTAAAVDKPAVTYIAVLPSEPPARIAIVVEGDTFLAYACGKTDEFNSANSAWYKGVISNGVLDATVEGKTLRATLAADVIRGLLRTGEERAREFTAKPVSRTAIAGLYRAKAVVNGEELVLGWIVDAKNQVVDGCQGTKRKPVALQLAKALPAPPPANADSEPEQKREAEELIVKQFEEEPEVAVQGEKVTSAVKPLAGKSVRLVPKKK